MFFGAISRYISENLAEMFKLLGTLVQKTCGDVADTSVTESSYILIFFSDMRTGYSFHAI